MSWRPDDWGYIAEEIRHHFIKERSVIMNVDVFELGASAMLSAVLKWLEEECTVKEHVEEICRINDWNPKYSGVNRKDCPQCMNELKEMR